MGIFDQKTLKQLKKVLDQMKDNVKIAYFTQEFECTACKEPGVFLEEFVELSQKLKLDKFDFIKDKEKAELYGIDRIPAIAIMNDRDEFTGIRFYGTPAGYEINSFVASIMEVSIGPGNNNLDIEKDIHIQVFVSLSCPYCPDAVMTAHKLALKNDKITADMIDISIFPHIANKYNVRGVPKIIINEVHELIGAQPEEEFLKIIEKL